MTSAAGVVALFFAGLASLGAAPGVAIAQDTGQLHAVPRANLCVTNGVITALGTDRLAVHSASSRAVAQIATGTSAEIRFRYLGPSTESKPLASGEMRRQIGIKLRARDSCNLLYAMWHIEPDAKFGVSVKRNPGKHTHAECHANGYTTIKPDSQMRMPQIRVGDSHTLRADLRGDRLEVQADGRHVWSGSLRGVLVDFDGPAGFRTDNARFEFEYLTAAPADAAGARVVDARLNHCDTGPED